MPLIFTAGKVGGKRKSAAKLNKEYELYEVRTDSTSTTYGRHRFQFSL
jgi:hypothetical protein